MATQFGNGGMILGLDIPQSVANINKDLVQVQKQLNTLQVTAQLSNNSINSIQQQIGSAINNSNTNTTINPNININKSNITKQISNDFKDAMDKVSSEKMNVFFKVGVNDSNDFKREVKKFVTEMQDIDAEITKIDVKSRTVFNDVLKQNVEVATGAIVTLKNEMGTITKELTYGKIGERYNPILQITEDVNGFREIKSSYVQNLEQMEKQTQSFNDKVTTSVTNITSKMNELYSKYTDVNGAKPITQSSNLQMLDKEFNNVMLAVKNLQNADESTFNSLNNQISSSISQFKILAEQLRNAENIANQLKAKPFNVVKEAEISRLEAFKDKLLNSGVGIQDVNRKIAELQTLMANATDAKGLTKYLNKLYTVKAEYNSISEVEKRESAYTNQIVSLEKKRKVALSGIKKYLAENTKLTSSHKKEAVNLHNRIKLIEAEIEKCVDVTDGIKLTNLNRELTSVKNQIKELGYSGQSFSDKLKAQAKELSTCFSIGTIIYGTINNIRKMVDTVVEVDTAMTNLRKVTDATDTSFNNFLDSARENAIKLGASLTDIIDATAEFSRLGYSLADSEELGKVATLYKNVGDGITALQASQDIVSIIKAFNIEAKDSISIIDKLNQVGNNMAISSAGIGEALRLSASALFEGNNTLSESIGLITGMNTVIQDPNVVGNAIKTISMRIRGRLMPPYKETYMLCYAI